MRLSALVSLALVASSSAFVPSTPQRSLQVSPLFAQLTSEEAVAAAKKASEEFGPTSPEARSAWDIVEEMDAAKSHVQKKEEPAPVEAVADKSSGNADFKIETSEQAMAEAKRITEEKGIASPDARLAWELVEELAATETHHKKTGSG